MEKAKLQLLSKHSLSTSTSHQEIRQYGCLNLPVDDPLEWWKTQTATFPHLSALARSILCIPATSTLSDLMFSTAGALLNAKRSAIAVGTVDKVIFII